jgi:transposase
MEAYSKLEGFEIQVRENLLSSPLNHCDETGININGGKAWLHCLSNSNWTYLYPHLRRGSEAMDEMGILPKYDGILCHDHWKPYYRYDCTHALCNAHHLRELECAYEQDKQQWAKLMRKLLVKINKAVNKRGGELSEGEIKRYQRRYRTILTKGETECPLPEKVEGKRGRPKKSKSRNLLERLRGYEEDVLRFMKVQFVPFTNNQAESDIRMTKVQQKISGCFRSMDGAKLFCRVRSYLSTARKNSVSSHQAMRMLFIGTLPKFAE